MVFLTIFCCKMYSKNKSESSDLISIEFNNFFLNLSIARGVLGRLEKVFAFLCCLKVELHLLSDPDYTLYCVHCKTTCIILK